MSSGWDTAWYWALGIVFGAIFVQGLALMFQSRPIWGTVLMIGGLIGLALTIPSVRDLIAKRLTTFYAQWGTPYPNISLVIVSIIGAALFGVGWRLIGALKSSVPTIEQYQNRKSTDPFLVGNMATSLEPAKDTKHMLVQFKVTVSNRGGMASVVKRWDFNWVCGDRKSPLIFFAPVYRIDKDAQPAFGLVDQQASDKIVIPPGGEAYYTLRYTIPVSPDEIKKNGIHLDLTLYDVMDHASDIEEHF